MVVHGVGMFLVVHQEDYAYLGKLVQWPEIKSPPWKCTLQFLSDYEDRSVYNSFDGSCNGTWKNYDVLLNLYDVSLFYEAVISLVIRTSSNVVLYIELSYGYMEERNKQIDIMQYRWQHYKSKRSIKKLTGMAFYSFLVIGSAADNFNTLHNNAVV